ncbi:hypothetical protein I4U23_000267 [Adineta vaga]|nr:hypothetical protein I4U23_000267 [Adineta vaga]
MTSTTEKHDNNLESYSLVWLNGTKSDYSDNEKRLRQVINHLKIFDDIDQTETYIRSVPKEDRIILLTDDQFSHDIISRIHSLPQIFSIYIYNSETNDWTTEFNKVCLFFINNHIHIINEL